MGRCLMALGQLCRRQGEERPAERWSRARLLIKGMRRQDGGESIGASRKAPVGVEDLAKLATGSTREGRDCKALLLAALWGMLRLGELAAKEDGFGSSWDARAKDLLLLGTRIEITLRCSKADWLGHGQAASVPKLTGQLGPCNALEEMKERRVAEGTWGDERPALMIGSQAAQAGKARARIQKILSGKAKEGKSKYGGHSLRKGITTLAAKAGVDEARKRWGRWAGDSCLLCAAMDQSDKEEVARQVWEHHGSEGSL